MCSEALGVGKDWLTVDFDKDFYLNPNSDKKLSEGFNWWDNNQICI